MANQRAPIEFNSLSGGIITEASALTFPDGASIDERNFELNKDGRRSRRLGFEQEVAGVDISVPVLYNRGPDIRFNSFLWKNVGGVSGLDIVVVQVLGKVHYFTNDSLSISSGKYETVTEVYTTAESCGTGASGFPLFDFASISGNLVIASGKADIIIVSPVFDGGGGLYLDDSLTSRLTIRDLFGIPTKYNRGVEGSGSADYIYITDPDYITKRPLLEGLPKGGTVPVTLEIAVANTREWITRTSVASSFGQTLVRTTHSGATFGITPTSVQGHKIRSIAELSAQNIGATYLTEVGPARVTSVVSFVTVPEFTKLTLTDTSTLNSALFVQDETDGRLFVYVGSMPGGVTVPAPLAFELTIAPGDTKSTLYKYNLRNQTFGVKRLPKTGEEVTDPIESFYDLAGKLPSSSDSIISSYYNNVEAGNKTAERFHAEDLLVNPAGSAPAPKGYFIIDALDRSASREVKWQELADDQGYIGEVVSAPLDSTPCGAIALAEFGGRVWYGGFSEVGTFTEQGGTRLDSYLLYSQLANSRSVLTKCYQKGDPTSVEEPDLIDSDGGFLSLDGAYGIHKLVPLGNALLVFAANGVWAVSGADDNYFTPTSPRVRLVTSKGSVSPLAIVVIDSIAMYWTEDGIYMVSTTELGSYNVESLTEKTIQSLYNEIPMDAKAEVSGSYDSYTSTVSWYIYNTVRRASNTLILSLLTTTGAFTVHEISDGTTDRTLVGAVKVSPYVLETNSAFISVGGNKVVVGTDYVTLDRATRAARPIGKKAMYIEDAGDGSSTFSFGGFSNEDFKDWGEVDAPAYMVTGYVSGGDFQRHKKTPYITFHFEKTENSFICPVDINNQSSCLVQAQWDWANSVNSGRWSRQFQAYRFRTHYIPESLDDTFDNGFSTVVTKNKIRGKGRVLSLKLSTEEGKDCRIIGWSAIMEVNGNV